MSEPLFWYRPVCNGEMYEGPIHNNSIGGKMMREEKPGEWLPLYTEPQAQVELNAARALLREVTNSTIGELQSLTPRIRSYLDVCDTLEGKC